MESIKVLVVHQSAYARQTLSELVDRSRHLKTVAVARHLRYADRKIKNLKPDVIALYLDEPDQRDLIAIESFVDTYSVPIVICSHSAKTTVRALQRGAVEFIEFPVKCEASDLVALENEIHDKLIQTSKVPIRRNDSPSEDSINDLRHPPSKQFEHKKTLVVIGASTGGPKALKKIISSLPKTFSAPILIVQHMPAHFTKSLAERINDLSSLNVYEASGAEFLEDGSVYIAPGDNHMTVSQHQAQLKIKTDQSAPVRGHRPSVDKLLNSVSKLNRVNIITVVLTGMGTDGTNGVKQIKKAHPNSIVIAESKETALIYGMPKSIVENIKDAHAYRLEEIAPLLVQLVDR